MTKNKSLTSELVANLRGRGFNYAANLIESQAKNKPEKLSDSNEICSAFAWASTHPGIRFWNYISAKLNEQWESDRPVIYCPLSWDLDESDRPVTYYPLNWDWVKNA